MTEFRKDIEGLRAVAILLVVAYHVGVPGVGGGYIGVDVFFVLSGYLITSLLLKELDETGTISFTKFYARRARRLLPAMAVVLFVTTVVSLVIYSPLEQDRFANTSLATATYLSNVYFARASTDYLAAPSQTNPLLHTWSLSVEEQFYFLWPLLVFLATSSLAGRRRERSHVFGAVVGIAVLSLALSVYLTGTRQPWAFFLSPARAWEFAIGAVAVLPWPWGAASCAGQPGRRQLAAGWLGLAGILAAAAWYGKTTVFPGLAAILPAVATAVVLRAGKGAPESGASRWLGSEWLQHIGRLSYSWYLWHWPLLVFADALFVTTLSGRIGVAVLGLAIAQGSYALVEKPIRQNVGFARRPYRALAMAAALAAFGVGTSLTWKVAAARWSNFPGQAEYSQMKYVLPSIYAMGCDDYFHSATVQPCAFGASDAPRTAVLLGDSHAGQWFPAVQRALEAQGGWQLIVLTKSACPIVDASFFFEDIGRVYTECHEWVTNVLDWVAARHPDLVLVGYASNYALSPGDWAAGMSRATSRLSDASRSVLILKDSPALGFDGPTCLARLSWRPRAFGDAVGCRRDLRMDEGEPLGSLQLTVSRLHPNVRTVDMTLEVCPNKVCDVRQNGVVTYRDAHHLTTQFVEYLAEPLAAHIRAALKEMSDAGVAPVAWR